MDEALGTPSSPRPSEPPLDALPTYRTVGELTDRHGAIQETAFPVGRGMFGVVLRSSQPAVAYKQFCQDEIPLADAALVAHGRRLGWEEGGIVPQTLGMALTPASSVLAMQRYATDLYKFASTNELSVQNRLDLSIQIVHSVCTMVMQGGIVHRDLKPPNILIYGGGDDPYTVLLCDFSLAKSHVGVDPSHAWWREVYSLWWRPPELLDTSVGDYAVYDPVVAEMGALGLVLAWLWMGPAYRNLYGQTDYNQLCRFRKAFRGADGKVSIRNHLPQNYVTKATRPILDLIDSLISEYPSTRPTVYAVAEHACLSGKPPLRQPTLAGLFSLRPRIAGFRPWHHFYLNPRKSRMEVVIFIYEVADTLSVELHTRVLALAILEYFLTLRRPRVVLDSDDMGYNGVVSAALYIAANFVEDRIYTVQQVWDAATEGRRWKTSTTIDDYVCDMLATLPDLHTLSKTTFDVVLRGLFPFADQTRRAVAGALIHTLLPIDGVDALCASPDTLGSRLEYLVRPAALPPPIPLFQLADLPPKLLITLRGYLATPKLPALRALAWFSFAQATKVLVAAGLPQTMRDAKRMLPVPSTGRTKTELSSDGYS